MRSNLELEDFLYDVPEVVGEWLGDRLFQESFDGENENWIYYTKEKNGLVSFLVNKGDIKAQNSAYLSSGPDTIKVTNTLTDTQRERVKELLELTMEAEYVDYCISTIKYMKYHHKFERLSNDGRFSTLINLTNSFIEVRNMLDKIEERERILNLFDYDPMEKLEELEGEIEEKSFVPDFKGKV